jgi:uncharacterized metal-binding protein YceD (DUF177 family)
VKKHDCTIEIAGLKLGAHTDAFSLGKDRFVEANPELLEDIDLQVSLALQKSETMVEVALVLSGTMTLVCDRTLRTFQEPIELSERLFFQFGEQEEELSEQVFTIPYQTQQLDLWPVLYDLVSLSVPIKKLHPDCRSEEDWHYQSGGEHWEEDADGTESADPRWEALKNLKFNRG